MTAWTQTGGRLTGRRAAWLTLAGSALALELAALWFQYGMGLDPCVMCVYERLAVMGLIAAGLLGAVRPGSAWLRSAAYLVWVVSAAWGLRLALRHVAIQTDPTAAFSCSFAAEFPGWMPLDEWLPALFLPTGYCTDVQWEWLSLSMAEWMVVVFLVYLLMLPGLWYLEWSRRR